LKKRTKKLLLPARQRVRDSRAKVFCFFSTEKQIFLVWLSTKVKFRFGAHFALHSAGEYVLPFGAPLLWRFGRCCSLAV
jgi:hypothetical protein